MIIDYQPVQVTSVTSMDRRILVANVVALAKTAKLYDVPVVLTTVNVSTGRNQSLIHQLRDIFPTVEPIDRTAINAWEDRDFADAVRATGRQKLVMAALWTEVCLAFPALDALRDGFEVYAAVDAVGGTSVEAHQAGLERIMQAGAVPVVGFSSPASCSATGSAKRRVPASWKSSSRLTDIEPIPLQASAWQLDRRRN
ncbi:isochorismatase family protein [Mesorhizobium sp. M0488]|uniref:isochorismatase family protein n=1 Tax=unclassified Mesorhizobium TaxID=325217 RepID=UPI00333C4117